MLDNYVSIILINNKVDFITIINKVIIMNIINKRVKCSINVLFFFKVFIFHGKIYNI